MNEVPLRGRRAHLLMPEQAFSTRLDDLKDDAPARGPHRTMPQGSERDAIFTLIRTTQMPERITGIRFDQPPKDIRHEKIGDFSVDPAKRPDRMMVACSLCSCGRPKFNTGSLLWSDDGYIRTLGNCCATDFFESISGGYRLIERRHEHRERFRSAESTLLTILPHMGDMFDFAHAINASAFCASSASKEFRRLLPGLSRALADAAKRGGTLDVVKRVKHEPPPSTPANAKAEPEFTFERETVGVMRGGRFVLTTYQPQSKVTPILGDILTLSFGQQPIRGEDEAVDYITSLAEIDAVAKAGVAAKLAASVKRLADDVGDAWQFLSDANLVTLRRWGEHRDVGIRFEIEFSRLSMRIDTQHGECLILDRKPFQVPLPELAPACAETLMGR